MHAIPRFGARIPPEINDVVSDCRTRHELVRGPQVAAFDGAVEIAARRRREIELAGQ